MHFQFLVFQFVVSIEWVSKTSLFGYPSKTDMSDQRPTCLIRDPSKIGMPDQRSTCLIRDPSETKSLIKHVQCVSDHTCLSSIRYVGLRSDMLISDEACQSPISYFGPWWNMLVSDQAYWSPIKHFGLRSDMSVSNGSPTGLW